MSWRRPETANPPGRGRDGHPWPQAAAGHPPGARATGAGRRAYVYARACRKGKPCAAATGTGPPRSRERFARRGGVPASRRPASFTLIVGGLAGPAAGGFAGHTRGRSLTRTEP